MVSAGVRIIAGVGPAGCVSAIDNTLGVRQPGRLRGQPDLRVRNGDECRRQIHESMRGQCEVNSSMWGQEISFLCQSVTTLDHRSESGHAIVSSST
eukprot:COSAG01_NODE_53877_length_336_cov_0.649789_1_plen_95_part_01